MSEIEIWPSRHISNSIEQLGDVAGAGRSVRILNDAIHQCKQRIATVGNQGEGATRGSVDSADEGDLGINQTDGMDSVRKRGGEYMVI